MTNTASGFIPNHKNGLVITLITFPYLGQRLGSRSIRMTNEDKHSPLIAMTINVKLVEYIFLFNGIKFISG